MYSMGLLRGQNVSGGSHVTFSRFSRKVRPRPNTSVHCTLPSTSRDVQHANIQGKSLYLSRTFVQQLPSSPSLLICRSSGRPPSSHLVRRPSSHLSLPHTSFQTSWPLPMKTSIHPPSFSNPSMANHSQLYRIVAQQRSVLIPVMHRGVSHH